MSSSVAHASTPKHANAPRGRLDGIRARTTKALIDPNSLQNAQETSENASGRQLVKAVLSRLNRSQKETAITAGCPDSDFSAALAGRQRFDIDWITKQDDAVVIEFAHGLLQSRGAVPANKRRVRMQTAMALMQQLWDAIEDDDQ